jgi:hypothetical protein
VGFSNQFCDSVRNPKFGCFRLSAGHGSLNQFFQRVKATSLL